MTEHHRKLERMYHAAPINRIYEPRLEVDDGQAVLDMQVGSHLHHAAGAVHGSVIFKALDDAAFFAASSLEMEFFVVTASFNVYLLRPVVDGPLHAEGRVTASTRSMYLAESVVLDAKGQVVARGSGQFMRSRTRLETVAVYA